MFISYEITCVAYSYRLSLVATACIGGMIRVWGFQLCKLEGECISDGPEAS